MRILNPSPPPSMQKKKDFAINFGQFVDIVLLAGSAWRIQNPCPSQVGKREREREDGHKKQDKKSVNDLQEERKKNIHIPVVVVEGRS